MMSVSAGTCAGTGSVAGATVAAALQFFAASQCLLQVPYPKQADVTNGSKFDFIIVGGGTAGSTLAARLAAVPHFEVLLLEAGGDPPLDSIIPAFANTLKGTSYDWNFTTVDNGYTSQALAGRHELQPRGKMLGGSGSLNDMVYSRGHPVDYEEWAHVTGDHTWSWDDVLPYFKKTERMTDPNIVNNCKLMQYHGTEGEIEVSGSNPPYSPTTALLKAFEELGINIVKDMTYPYKIGAGKFSHTIKNGRRDSALTALLNKVQSNNLHVLKNTFVTEIIIENNTAVGVKALTKGEEIYLYAEKEVIVTAGTFNTAKLLLLSGIGPEDHLKDMGIDVVQNLPVGENLQDHVMVIYCLAAESGTCPLDPSNVYFDVIRYLHDRTGSLSYIDSMAVYLPQKHGDPNVPYFAIYPTCVPQSSLPLEACMGSLGFTEDTCMRLVSENKQHELLLLPVVLLKPQSRGKVTLSSADPSKDPLIFSGSFKSAADLEGYPEAVRTALSLVNTSYFEEKSARIVDLTPNNCKCRKGVEQIRCQARNLAMSAWHSVGTAALGAVLDARLRVRGVARLRVADASVMPTIVRGNTNAPVVMIAEKAADFIKNTYLGQD